MKIASERRLKVSSVIVMKFAVGLAAAGAVALSSPVCFRLFSRDADSVAREAAAISEPSPRFQASEPAQPTDGRPALPEVIHVAKVTLNPEGNGIRLCQAYCDADPTAFSGVDCQDCVGHGEATWNARRPIPWQVFAQGEYVGPARIADVPEYRLRVDDQIDCVYRVTRNQSARPYELGVGDRIQFQSLADQDLDRELIILPDGTITLRLLGAVPAAGRTAEELRADLEERYMKYYRAPAISVTPLSVNTKLEDLRATIDKRAGIGGQAIRVQVTPEGTIQLPAIGSVPTQGLTLAELGGEIGARYAEVVDGIEVTPVLSQRAPRYVYVVGEVANPGRFTLDAPTSVMQSIALAGGWRVGANLRQVVVFRRAQDWHLMATKLDVRGALYGKRPCPADEIWLRDSDIVAVPKSPVLVADDFIELVFRRGLYGVLPFFGLDDGFVNLSTM